MASVCLSIGYLTRASAPHSIANEFKNLLAIVVLTDIDFKGAATSKEFSKDLSKFVAATVSVVAAAFVKKEEFD